MTTPMLARERRGFEMRIVPRCPVEIVGTELLPAAIFSNPLLSR